MLESLELVTHEQAKAIKELGFPQDDKYGYTYYENGNEIGYVVPTLELVAKWLRDEKGIFINVHICTDFKYQVYLQTTLKKDHNIISEASQYVSYEEALSAGISRAIEHL